MTAQRWWTTVALDAQIALASGLPPMIESKFYNVSFVDEGDDNDFSFNLNKTILDIFVGGHYKFYRHASDFLRIINSHRVTKGNVDVVLAIVHLIGKDMARRTDHITQRACMLREPSGGGSQPQEELHQAQWNPVFASFAVSVLSMLASKPYAFMYGPLQRHNLLPYLREREPK
jgi:hypothetical protein